MTGFTQAPGWSLTVGHLGSLFVLGAAFLFLISAIAAASGRFRWIAKWSFGVGSVSVLGAMACLVALFLKDQFQFDYVARHSWRELPQAYKVAAVWSGQQGSFLLWSTTSAVFGLLTFWRTGSLQRWYIFAYAIFLGSLCGILAYETPFGLAKDLVIGGQTFIPPDGLGLTPSLQNYWVIIHPPTIFLGFGSLTVLFAYAASAMLSGDLKGWISRVRPWALVSLFVLGLGLVMGGLWAYETQGWGGFWAWDPVENVSFVPWLFTVAFVHGIIVQTAKKRWHGTNALLGGLPFLLFVYGTFLTRSGFLSKFSVHSFAEMNRSALWILLTFTCLVAAGFISLWAIRGRRLAKTADRPLLETGLNREWAYQSGVILITGLATAIAIGMSVPFFLGLAGSSGKVVEEPLYHSVVVWFFVPVLLLVGIAPFLSWRRAQPTGSMSRLLNVAAITLGVLGFLLLWVKLSDFSAHSHEIPGVDFPFGLKVPRLPWVFVLAGVTLFAAIANLWRLVEMIPRSKLGIGGVMAHLGVATALAGLILSRGLEQKEQIFVSADFPGVGLGYTIRYKGMTSNPVKDRDNKVLLQVESTAGQLATFVARPGFFFTFADMGQPQPFTWPHIEHVLTHDVYLSLAQPIVTLWDQPQTFKPGETKPQDDFSVTYLRLERHGNPGQPGTWFGARLRITENGKTYESVPRLGVSEGPTIVSASPTFNAVFEGMDVATNSAIIDLQYKHPIFPIELFYKPMTMLVWLGTGILTLGGLLSAFYRRDRRLRSAANNVEEDEDALIPTA